MTSNQSLNMMRDMQRGRMRHLLANAIVELWKKETGSMSSVMIEGTICITSGSGRTTVVQVADKFRGSIPEAEDDVIPQTMFSPSATPQVHKSSGVPPHTPTLYANQNAMAAFLDNLSPASITSPTLGNSRSSSQDGQSPIPQTPLDKTSSSDSLKNTPAECEDYSADSSSDLEIDVQNDEGHEFEEKKIAQEESMPELDMNSNCINKTSQLQCSKTPVTSKNIGFGMKRRHLDMDDAMDLTKREENDLALSPPQSYTAQVRDAIRSKLLQAQLKAEEEGKSVDIATKKLPDWKGSAFEKYSRMPFGSTSLNSPGVKKSSSEMPAAMSSYLTRPLISSMMLSGGNPSPTMMKSSGSHSNFPLLPTAQPVFPTNGQPEDLKPESKFQNGSEGSSCEEVPSVYKCDYCQKQFLFKSKYHEHLPVHTNIRPYQCHLCSRTYKYKYDLRVHLRTHMGIPTKSTICPFCNVKFETNKMLRLHIKDAHQDLHKATEEECTQPSENLPPAL